MERMGKYAATFRSNFDFAGCTALGLFYRTRYYESIRLLKTMEKYWTFLSVKSGTENPRCMNVCL